MYSRLYEHATGKTNHRAFDLLCRAKLLNKINTADPSGLPLGSSGNRRFKASVFGYWVDAAYVWY